MESINISTIRNICTEWYNTFHDTFFHNKSIFHFNYHSSEICCLPQFKTSSDEHYCRKLFEALKIMSLRVHAFLKNTILQTQPNPSSVRNWSAVHTVEKTETPFVDEKNNKSETHHSIANVFLIIIFYCSESWVFW